MTTRQQKEALHYFKDHAENWKNKALSADQREVNVIQQRNSFVHHVIKNSATIKSTLDVGCGTGDLVCDIARMGICSTGVDFANEMIDIACARAEKEKLEKAHFYCSSIFDFDLTKRRYDVVSANGFIEYISLDELDQFLGLSYQALNLGGSLILGSRNRLFNIFSVNAFALEEITNGAAILLMREAIAVASGATISELATIETAPLQRPNAEHEYTGIDVSTRYQFTPAQLIKMLKGQGFTIKQIYPIHIHGVPPAFKDQYPDIHTSISNLLHNYADEHASVLPYSSSFMLHAKKEC
ncbi:MAG TPA: class I SAM-dependent methyltransferase [Gammaproteobacteria bacterium]|nr:class I SAM-dependent methyltransferase [Gammaproteobacteria bacterium]